MDTKGRYLEILDKIGQIEELKNIADFEQDLGRYRQRLQDSEFRIAVVGEFSSGKSTFINALIGKDILSHATTETTATITRIINVKTDDKRCFTGHVNFRDGSSREIDNIENLKDYTTTESSLFNVVNDVESVEINVPVMDSSAKVVIVDTPGLNGMADGHREVTVDIIKKAHACIYLLQKRGLTETDVEFLTYLLKYQRNFIFVQNFIDEFKEYEGENVDKKIEEQKKILQEKVFVGEDNLDFSICGISALQKLASVDKNIKRIYSDSQEDLTDLDRKELSIQSNFVSFERIIQERFSEKILVDLQCRDIVWVIGNWIQELSDYAIRQQNNAADALEISEEKNFVDRLQRFKKKVEDKKDSDKKNLENFVIAELSDIRKKTEKDFDKTLDDLNSEFSQEIDQWNTISKLNEGRAKLSRVLNNRSAEIEDNSKENLKHRMEELYQVVSSEIEEYSGIKSSVVIFPTVTLNDEMVSPPEFKESDRTQSLEYEKLEKCGAIDAKERSICEDRREKEKVEKDIVNLRKEMDSNKNSYLARIRQLGGRPSSERVFDRNVVEREERTGFFGPIVQLFCGKKEIQRPVYRDDDSRGIEWDKKRKELLNNFESNQQQLEYRKRVAENTLRRLNSEVEDNESTLKRLNERVKEIDRQLERQKQIDKEMFSKAQTEYILTEKKKIKAHVSKYICETVKELFVAYIENSVNKFRGDFLEWTFAKYEEAVNNKLQWIQKSIDEKSPKIREEFEMWNSVNTRLINIKEELK